MKKAFILILLTMWAGFPGLAKIEDKSSNAKLRLPWDVLQDVLKLDAKNVRLSWDEYKTLLRLTAPKNMPEITRAGGDVILSREEFTRLVQSLVPPAPSSAEATVSKGSYRGKLVGSSAVFTAYLRVDVPRRPPKPLLVDLFPGQVAFQEIKLNDRPALAQVLNGRLHVTVAEAGTHTVELRFSVPVPESNATQSLTIPIARTPLTEWIMEIPEKNLDIAVTPSLHREQSTDSKGTRVRALLAPSNYVTTAWNPLAPDIAKGPAQIYADVDHLISIHDDSLRIKSRLSLDVLQNTINALTLDLPDGFSVLDVHGDNVKEWQEIPGKKPALFIPLRTARKGPMEILVVLERILPGEKTTSIFTGLSVRGAVRQRGHIGVELKTDAELPAPITENLEPKDPFRELPGTLAGQSARLLFGYKYTRLPFSLSLSLSRHESVNVVPSVIDRAEGTTVVRPDGKQVHRITYSLRGSSKQFLEVVFPDRTQLWSAFVGGAPVKPVRGEGGKTLIPLVRSSREDNAVVPVELVYFGQRPRLSVFGREELALPMPDVLVSRLRWSVITPPDQRFFYLGNDFEKQEPPIFVEPNQRGFLGGRKIVSKLLRGKLARKPSVGSDNFQEGYTQLQSASDHMDEMEVFDNELKGMHDRKRSELSGPVPPSVWVANAAVGGANEAVPESMTAGILPVRVHVPAVGNTVTYTKTLPEPNGLLTLPLYHVATWARAAGWIFVLGVVSLLGWTFRGLLKRSKTMNPFKSLLFILALGLTFPAFADETPENTGNSVSQGEGELSLPWAAFEKLLKLDQDNILLTWDEFQRLLKQTGVQEMPPFQLQNGRVSLSRAEFKNLLDRMKLPAGEESKIFLTKALYTGKVTRKGTTLTAKINIQVISENPVFIPAKIPLFTGEMAFEDILMDGKPALIENNDGYTTVTALKPGEHVVTAVFTLPATLDKDPYRLNFNIPETPITQIDLVLAASNLDARVAGASQVQTTPGKEGTRVRASLPQTNAVAISWNAVEPERAKGPAKVYATVHQVVSVQDDAVRVTAGVELDVLQNAINNLSIVLPDGYTLLDVTGEAVGEWKKRGEGERTLFVPFAYARKGRFNVTLKMERAFKEKGSAVLFEGFRVLGAVRESGDLLVEKATNGEVKVSEKSGLSRLDSREIPDGLRGMASQTFLDAYKYIRPPIRLGLDIQRHQEIAVVSSVVDSANAVTLFLKDGKCVTHLTLTVKNTARQFVELKLPAGADVWSVFVEGRTVRPSKNEKGATLIPLNRSRMEGDALTPFEVEILYFQNMGRPALVGVQRMEVPALDLKISQLLWSVYLPTDQSLLHFDGSVDKEKDAGGLRPLSAIVLGKQRILRQLSEAASDEIFLSRGSSSLSDKDARVNKARQSPHYSMRSDFDESQGVDENAYAQQVEREINFFGNVNRPQVAGDGAPIRIKVPNAGQIFRFSKVLVQEHEPITLEAYHVHGLLVKAIKGLFVLMVLILLFRSRSSVVRAVTTLRASLLSAVRWIRLLKRENNPK